jgi:hypothetical protein
MCKTTIGAGIGKFIITSLIKARIICITSTAPLTRLDVHRSVGAQAGVLHRALLRGIFDVVRLFDPIREPDLESGIYTDISGVISADKNT